ncbi:MAG: hypothetical protein NZP72_15250 [Geminicoccaceae bacterium]|nr:hypothetical protein [Geminicoccaceae bacterium]
MKRGVVVYLGGSALLVSGLYLLWADRVSNGAPLLLEALFAWLVLFVPPLVLWEGSRILARRLLASARLRSRKEP